MAPGASSLRSLTRLILLLLSLPLFFRSTPPTPTQPTSCSRRLFGSPRPSSSKVTEAIAAEPPSSSSSSSYLPMSLPDRPTPPSIRFSNSRIPNQVSLFRTKRFYSKIGGSSMTLHFPRTVRSESRVRFRLGYCPKMSSQRIILKRLLKNFSRYLGLGTSEFLIIVSRRTDS